MKRLFTMVILLLLCISMIGCSNTNILNNNVTSKLVEVTPEEYNDIREGMTYKDVCNIIGGKEMERTVYEVGIKDDMERIEQKNRYLRTLIDQEEERMKNQYSENMRQIVIGYLEEMYNSYIQETPYIVSNETRYKTGWSDAERHWRNIETDLSIYEKDLRYQYTYICTWQGQKISPNAEYRGSATIYFKDDIVVAKECKDLE